MDFYGIDFSGSADQWKSHVSSPAVWVARLSPGEVPEVKSLVPVQDLPGAGTPFDRLADLLADGHFRAAGIDAPFSVPAAYVPANGWRGLIQTVQELPHEGRPFPGAEVFLQRLTGGEQSKPLRLTEMYWRRKNINVRSTLWWKPRGGAPFAAACMKLIAKAAAPCWPWVRSVDRGLLVEAFPAAQLKQWGLRHYGYNGKHDDCRATRDGIVDSLRERVKFGLWLDLARKSADALDAVIAAFAAIAVAKDAMKKPDSDHADGARIEAEGWISVHR